MDLKPIPTPLFILNNSKPVTKVLFSIQEDDLIFTGNRNGDFNIYSLNKRRSLFNGNAEKQSILSIIELDSNNILSYNRNGSVYKWTKNATNYENSRVYQNEVYTFCPTAFDTETRILYIPSKKASYIDCIEVNSFNKINTFQFTKSDPSKLGMLMSMQSIDTNYLIGGFESGELILFDNRNYQEVENLNLFSGQPVMCFDYSGIKKFGCSGSVENLINQFNIDFNKNDSNKTTMESIGPIELTNPGLNCIKFRNNDSKIFATGGWDSRIRIFGSKKRNLLAVLNFHKEAVNTIDFSGQNLMASGSNDGIISFWNIYN